MLRERVRLSVAGRTDAGVHAWAQVVSFSCARRDVVPERLRLSLNALLPPDVAVLRVSPAPPGFVAREAASRSYRYDLWETAVKPVRERAFVWVVRGPVDGAALRAAAGLLPGRRDFAALTPSAHLYHHCVREVTAAAWTDDGPTPDGDGRRWRFEITAGSFLHNMVRVAVGSMVDVAQGRMTLEDVRGGAGLRRAPPHGPDGAGPGTGAGPRRVSAAHAAGAADWGRDAGRERGRRSRCWDWSGPWAGLGRPAVTSRGTGRSPSASRRRTAGGRRPGRCSSRTRRSAPASCRCWRAT